MADLDILDSDHPITTADLYLLDESIVDQLSHRSKKNGLSQNSKGLEEPK